MYHFDSNTNLTVHTSTYKESNHIVVDKLTIINTLHEEYAYGKRANTGSR